MDWIHPSLPLATPRTPAAPAVSSGAASAGGGPSDSFAAGSGSAPVGMDAASAARLVLADRNEGDKVREIRSENAQAAKDIGFLWGYQSDAPIYCKPLVADGNLYFSNAGGRVFALDAGNGKLKWDSHFDTTTGQNSAPEMARAPKDGTLYCGTMGHTVNALDPLTGRVRWSTDVGAPVFQAPVPGSADGPVVCGTRYGRLLGLDPADGQVKWDLKLGDEISSVPVVDAKNGNVYATATGMCRDGNFQAIDWATGQKKWSLEEGGQATCAPIVDSRDQTVYTGMFNGTLYALDPANGRKLWEFPTGRSILVSPVLDEARYTLYCASSDGKLYALEPSTGQMKWSREMGDGWGSGRAEQPPLVDPRDVTVYCGCADGGVFAFEPTGGNIRWHNQADGRVSALQLDGKSGTLYFGSADARFRAVDGQSVRELWQITSGGSAMGQAHVDPVDGSVYFGDVEGIMYALASPEVCVKREATQQAPAESVRTEIRVEEDFVVVGGLRLPRRRSTS